MRFQLRLRVCGFFFLYWLKEFQNFWKNNKLENRKSLEVEASVDQIRGLFQIIIISVGLFIRSIKGI